MIERTSNIINMVYNNVCNSVSIRLVFTRSTISTQVPVYALLAIALVLESYLTSLNESAILVTMTTSALDTRTYLIDHDTVGN